MKLRGAHMPYVTSPNKITGANGGGPSRLQAVHLVAAVAQFCRSA